MIEPDKLAEYLDGGLDPAARARIEAELAADPESLRQALDQRRLDQALQVLLCPSVRRERLRQSILAAVQGRSTQELTDRVLSATSGRNSWRESLRAWLDTVRRGVRRPAFVCGVAIALGLALTWSWRSRPMPRNTASQENPSPRSVGAGRDPAFWPFAARSPWNHPIGSGAVFVDVNSPGLNLANGAGLFSAKRRPVVLATTSDPRRRILAANVPEPFIGIRIPIEPSATSFDRFVLIDEDHRFAYEMTRVRRVEGGDLAAQRCLEVDLRSDGVPPFHRGSAISAISYLAGMLRQSELDRGIAHALSGCVPQTALTRTGPEDPAFVWPALLPPNIGQWGRPWLESLAKTGNLRLGALLAIPGSVDITKIGLGNSGPGFELARALQDYGVYVTGTFEDGGAGPEITQRLIINAEPGLTDKLPADVNAALTLVAPYLKIVINNGPQSIGGGGTPRCSWAPEFFP